MKKALLLFLICILTLIMTCSCSKKMFDKYAKYEARPEKNSGILCYEYNLRKFKVTDTYITEEAQQAAIIRVRVYNESHEADDAKQSTISKRTLTKAKVLEVYFTSDDLDYELKSDDTIWLAQGFFCGQKKQDTLY